MISESQQLTLDQLTGMLKNGQARIILGLIPGASTADINTVWKHLMRRIHPDAGGTDGMAMLLNEAREVLLRKTAG